MYMKQKNLNVLSHLDNKSKIVLYIMALNYTVESATTDSKKRNRINNRETIEFWFQEISQPLNIV